MALLVLVVAGAPQAVAAETFVTLIDWTEGRFLVGSPLRADGANAARLPFDADDCPRRLLLDIMLTRERFDADAGIAYIGVPFEVVVEVWRDGVRESATTVRGSGYGKPVGLTQAGGEHELVLHLRTGAATEWSARLRGHAVPGVVACMEPVLVAELELDPEGADAGHEWIELLNPGPASVDLGGWTLRADAGGAPLATLPSGTFLAAGARIVVPLDDAAALDAPGARLLLEDGLGNTRDAAPSLSDAADDARSWQRLADGSWSFRDATPGAGPASDG